MREEGTDSFKHLQEKCNSYVWWAFVLMLLQFTISYDNFYIYVFICVRYCCNYAKTWHNYSQARWSAHTL